MVVESDARLTTGHDLQGAGHGVDGDEHGVVGIGNLGMQRDSTGATALPRTHIQAEGEPGLLLSDAQGALDLRTLRGTECVTTGHWYLRAHRGRWGRRVVGCQDLPAPSCSPWGC